MYGIIAIIGCALLWGFKQELGLSTDQFIQAGILWSIICLCAKKD